MGKKRIVKLITDCVAALDELSAAKKDKNKEKLNRTLMDIQKMMIRYDDEIKEVRKELRLKNKLVREVKESMEELLSIQKLSQTIRFAKNPEEIYSTLVELSKKVVPIEMSEIFLFDRKTNEISSLGGRDIQDKLKKEIQRFIEEGIVDWVIDEKKIIVIPDLETISNEGLEDLKRNFVFIPLIVSGEGMGVFLIYTPKKEKTFTKQNLELLALLTEQAAIAIENYKIKEKLQKIQKEYNESKEGQMVVEDKN